MFRSYYYCIAFIVFMLGDCYFQKIDDFFWNFRENLVSVNLEFYLHYSIPVFLGVVKLFGFSLPNF